MKDLKHLYYFESLLENALNPLVREALDEGKKCIGTTCENVPEPLLNLDNCFGIRLRAPRSGSLDISTYYMTNFLCEYTRALLERAIEGGFNFTDCIITPDGCTMMNRCVENMELLKINPKPDFFFQYMEIPMKANQNGLNLYVRQCQNHILTPLKEKFGTDTSDAAIRKAVALHNEVCSLIREIGEFRKEENPRITNYEFHVICLVTYVVPKDKILSYLKETLEELKTRKPEEKNPYRARVVFIGSEVDDCDLMKLLDDCGCYVAADRYCYGSLPGRDIITLNEEEDALTQLCRIYMNRAQCVRYMDTNKIEERQTYVDNLAKAYQADGLIYQQMKFCDPWAYERTLVSHIMREEHNYPVLSIDRPYTTNTSGQLRTRFQAFVESVEIKKIQGGTR